MKLEQRKVGDVVVLAVDGRVTIGHGNVLGKAFEAATEEGARDFVFNFSETAYMDSASIGEVVVCLKRARERGGSLKLVVQPGGKLREMLEIAMLDRLFELYRTEDEAVRSFGP